MFSDKHRQYHTLFLRKLFLMAVTVITVTLFSMSVFFDVYASVVTFTQGFSEGYEATEIKNGWSDNRYYENGEPLKGVHLIDDTYYIFDKYSGEYTGESGDTLFLGCFFSSMYGPEDWDNYTDNSVMPVMYLTVDGLHLHYFDNLWESLTEEGYKSIFFDDSSKNYDDYVYIFSKFRDPAPLIHDGKLYLAGTSPDKDRDYAILETNDLLSWDWAPTANVYNDGSKNVWAPRWFTDGTGGYWNVFCGYESMDHSMENGRSGLYVTKVELPLRKDGKVFENSEPEAVRLLGVDSRVEPFMYRVIGGDVFKTGYDSYYMIVKRERNESYGEIMPSCLMMFECSDTGTFTDWSYVTDLSFQTRYGEEFPYSVEGAAVIEINDTYYLYGDVYESVEYDNYGNKTGGYRGISVFTSDDPLSGVWREAVVLSEVLSHEEKGYMDYLRHGNFTVVDREDSFILQTYNGVVKDPGESYNIFDGEKKVFTENYAQIYNGMLIGMPWMEQTGGTGQELMPGFYFIDLKPKEGMLWSDGTSETKTVVWHIWFRELYYYMRFLLQLRG